MKYNLNDIIIINSQNPKLEEVNGTKGYVYGTAFDEGKQLSVYAIMSLKNQIVYCCYENELIETSEKYLN